VGSSLSTATTTIAQPVIVIMPTASAARTRLAVCIALWTVVLLVVGGLHLVDDEPMVVGMDATISNSSSNHLARRRLRTEPIHTNANKPTTRRKKRRNQIADKDEPTLRYLVQSSPKHHSNQALVRNLIQFVNSRQSEAKLTAAAHPRRS